MKTTKTTVVMLKVTKKDIREGIREGSQGDDQYCPMALALARRFRRFRKVYIPSVGSTTAIVGDLTFALTAKARRWISRFDYGMSVKPTTFRLVGRTGP